MSPEPHDGLRLLVIVAHPHDLCHMGGTCAHHVERGDRVTVVAITGGQTTHDEELADELRKSPGQRDMTIVGRSPEEYAASKAREFVNVSELFGIADARILPFADNPIEVTDAVVQALAEILYDVQPQMVLTHAPYTLPDRRSHYAWIDDHTAAGIAVQRALQKVNIPDRNQGHAPHKVASVYYTGVDYAFHEVDVCIDISDQVENRKKAEILFESQGHTPELAEKRIESSAGFQGWKAHIGYAETFIRGYREISRCLSVTEENLLLAEMSHEERLRWQTGEGPSTDR